MLSQILRVLAQRSAIPTRRLLRNGCTASHALSLTLPFVSQRHRRMSTPAPHLSVSEVSMERYHTLSDATMDILLEALESLLDRFGNASYEVEYHSGVLTLVLGDKGTYVINKQPPNKQIWLSSPFSGPKRYDYSESDDNWLYSRDGCTMGDLLNDELSRVLEQKVDLCVAEISQQID